MKCSLVVDELVVKKLVDGPVYEKFIRFITKAFVEDSDGRIKWCPQPNCGHAITAGTLSVI
jgi:ariadne-1